MKCIHVNEYISLVDSTISIFIQQDSQNGEWIYYYWMRLLVFLSLFLHSVGSFECQYFDKFMHFWIYLIAERIVHNLRLVWKLFGNSMFPLRPVVACSQRKCSDSLTCDANRKCILTETETIQMAFVCFIFQTISNFPLSSLFFVGGRNR